MRGQIASQQIVPGQIAAGQIAPGQIVLREISPGRIAPLQFHYDNPYQTTGSLNPLPQSGGPQQTLYWMETMT